MFSKIREMISGHVKKYAKTYFTLLMAFVVGVSAGAFTVNGLSSMQKDELTNYFQGFLQLFEYQKLDSGELLRISLTENLKLVLVFWILGVTIIGIPFIFFAMGVRGFITGFSTGFLIKILGGKGILFTLLAVFPKEIIMIPCFIALGVNGINFSLNIIKNRSIRRISGESLKTNLLAYCFVTLFYSGFIFAGVLIEAYITPVFIRMLAPLLTG